MHSWNEYHEFSYEKKIKNTDELHKYNIGQKKQIQNNIILYHLTYIKSKNSFFTMGLMTDTGVKNTTKFKPKWEWKKSISLSLSLDT